MRVLIVEDNAVVAQAVAAGLRDQGIAVDVAGDGAAGLDKAELSPYDVIVLDRDLPEVHGDDVCARRRAPSVPPVLRRGELTLDRPRRRASRNGQLMPLTRKELGVLEVLMSADGAVISAEQLLEQVWDEYADPFTNAVAVTVMRLRRKLGQPPLIETVTGGGYRLP